MFDIDIAIMKMEFQPEGRVPDSVERFRSIYPELDFIWDFFERLKSDLPIMDELVKEIDRLEKELK